MKNEDAIRKIVKKRGVIDEDIRSSVNGREFPLEKKWTAGVF
jgi:hypothetical protein